MRVEFKREPRPKQGRAVDRNSLSARPGLRHTPTARRVTAANIGRGKQTRPWLQPRPRRHIRKRGGSCPRGGRAARALPALRRTEGRRRRRECLGAGLGRLCRAGHGLLARLRWWDGLGSAPRRQQGERIDVALRLRGQSHAEVQVRRLVLRLPAWPDRADHVALRDRGPDTHGDRAQVHKRDREAVGRADRQRQARSRNGSSKADDARLRCPHVRARRRSDVDAPVLAAGIRVVVEREASEHRPVGRPAPGARSRRRHQRSHDRKCDGECVVARFENHAWRMVTAWSAVVNFDYREPR